MIEPSVFPTYRSFSLILICAMLGACATTQKSSTGSGDQAAAPISEAAKPQTAAKPGETPSSSSSGAASGNTGAKQGSSESSAASSDNDDAAQLKHQLAEQDAQINKLRSDRLAGAKDQSASSGAASTTKAQDELAVFPSDGKTAGDSSGQPAVAAVLERSVYFDYDQFSIPEKYDSMLIDHAAYLKAHPDFKAEVQGNCDERGSREYNLALGARRAESVKRALELAGADGSRISAISFGSEKPVATGKDEESYSQNRRADIVY